MDFYLMLTFAMSALPAAAAYSNITLESPIMSVKIFMPMLPKGRAEDSADDDKYYVGSRFEHGSMIGDVVFGGDRGVYGRGLWRTPHDSGWPESGVGLASEFGCGDNGASCVGKGDITNGVLGYDTAKAGEPFLKIGVGALVKGSCPECVGDENGQYKFNSPYKFHRPPSWKVLPSPDPNEITFVSEEKLGDFGYRIQKTARVDGSVLTVRSLLTNLGKKQFTTPWYSHHFFTGDHEPVGPGYKLDLGLSEYGLQTPTPQFKQPGLGSWSEDLNDYANVTMARDGSISMKIKKVLPEGTRLKAEFLDENTITLTDGSFTLHAPNGISVTEKIPELQTQSRNPFIYAYNVYAERGTLSPEPMLLLYLQPAETTFWTQHLRFASDKNPSLSSFMSMFQTKAWQSPVNNFSSGSVFMLLAAFCAVLVASYIRFNGPRRRFEYSSIPDQPPKQEAGGALSVV
ncbi:hypothetical protein ACHAXR_003115 [Thalassiosira sp. AJA248-18]